MPRRVDYETQKDFTGGLYLDADAFVLPPNATPDCLNVDIDGRGGFYLRRGVKQYKSVALGAAVHSILPYTLSTGTSQVVVGAGTGLYKWTGAAWSAIFSGAGFVGPYRSATFKDRLYVCSGNNSVQRWDGTTNTAVPDSAGVGGYNDNIAAPTAVASTGHFPKAEVLATYQNVVFAANITEDTTAYPCRIRWSHPGYAEDWMSYHYIDIEPEDGDEITALVPMQDRLIVFKHNSIHAIYGNPPESFTVTPIARDVGATSQEAVAPTDLGVYFWHESTGLHQLVSDPQKGTRTTWVWEPLWPAIVDGSISAGNLDAVQVGWLNRRIWVGVPWESGTSRDRTFVFDPFIGKKGAWTAYDLAVGPFLNFTPPSGAATPIAASTSSNFLVTVDTFDQFYDDIGAGAVHIDSHYMTRWHDAGEAIIKKRWKRPEAVILGGQASTLVVSAYRDYDPTFAFKTFNVVTAADGTAPVWDTAVFDTAVWGREGGDIAELKRGSPLGNARSVALKFTGPSTNVNWRVDALTFKWVAKRVRN